MRLINKVKLLVKNVLGHDISGVYAKIRKDDIYLISYPKSGNTWMRFLIGNVIYTEGVNFKTINSKMPDIYITTKQEIDSMKSPRVIKSHEKYDKKYPKVVYIYRDPRDVVVSYYYWYKKFEKEKFSDFNEFFNAFMKGEVLYGLWSDHVAGWKNASVKDSSQILLVEYESLKKDTFSEMKRILTFCDITATDEQIIRSIKLSDFKAMQKLELKQEKESFLNKTDTSIKFVRAGKSEWQNVLGEAQIERINSEFGNLIKEFQI